MLSLTYLAFALSWLVAPAPQVEAARIEFGPGTVLVYRSKAGEQESQFIIRIARFEPDRFLEWESVSHQGTVHLYTEAVEEARRLSLNALFDPGVDVETRNETTKWLSRRLLNELIEKRKCKALLNGTQIQFRVEGEETYPVKVDKKELQVSVLRVNDDRRGRWLFQNSLSNPVLVEYENPYYREFLEAVVNSGEKSFRWIRQVPPIK